MNSYNKILKRFVKSQRGIVLINVLVIGMILTLVGLSLTDLVITQHRRTSNNVFTTNATLTAEAGIEETLHELNLDNEFGGFTTEQEFFNDDRGRGAFTTEVTSGEGEEKIIVSAARTYRPNSDIMVSERKIRVSLVGTSSSEASVFAGVGGLILGGSANINNSDVFVNGTIDMSGASRIGSHNNPVNVDVAYQSCPTGSNPGPTYPEVCTSGEPISFTSSTRIYGDVCATNQTSTRVATWQTDHSIQGGDGGQGLILGCVAPPRPMIEYDRDEHIANMTVTGNASDSTYDCSTWVNPDGFERTWPANLRLNGNVNATSSCDLTITGDVYITGNLTIGGGARIRIADSLGNTRPVIVVDGTINAGGGAQIIENSSGVSAHFISFKSTASCSPDCEDVTGTDLYNSRNQQNITVNGGGNYPGAVFQAYWSKVRVSGSGLIGSALGQTVDLNGAGNITFGTSLSSGETTWTIRSYQREF